MTPRPTPWTSVARVLIGLLAMSGPLRPLAGQEPIRGFPAQAVPAQRAREALALAVPNRDSLAAWMRQLTERPHVTGSERDREVAQLIQARWRSYGLDARIEQFEALMPIPISRRVELLGPDRHIAVLREPGLPEDPSTTDPTHLEAFSAYSADGDVTAEVVYVNYGQLEDYLLLDSLGVDLRGKVVLSRAGGMPQPKWRLGAERGAVACIIYHDPADDGYMHGDTYPDGPRRPNFAIASASVLGWDHYAGDPLTPGWASEPGARRLSLAEAKSLPPIPVVPISARDALPFLRALAGPVAPQAWRGALPVTYRLGPGGPARARVSVRSDWQTRPLYNVIAMIPGARSEDQWVILGNHHDAWGPGADDPISGQVALDGAARSAARLLETGWRPSRSLVFVAWGGHEWGLMGSTEWVEKHAATLRERAVVYLNGDNVQRGWIRAQGVPSLGLFLREVARDLPDPTRGTSVLGAWQANPGSMLAGGREGPSTQATPPVFMPGPIGMNSDYSPFILHLGVPAMHIAYSGQTGPLGARHTIYETFQYYTRHLDPGFATVSLLAQTFATAALRLADAAVVPFEFTAAALLWRTQIEEVGRLAARDPRTRGLDLAPANRALDAVARAAARFESASDVLARAPADRTRDRWAALAPVNRLVYTAEQLLTDSAGVPGRSWNRHLVQGAGPYSRSGVTPLPALRSAVEERRDLALAQREVARLAAAFDRYARRVDEAAAQLLAALR